MRASARVCGHVMDVLGRSGDRGFITDQPTAMLESHHDFGESGCNAQCGYSGTGVRGGGEAWGCRLGHGRVEHVILNRCSIITDIVRTVLEGERGDVIRRGTVNIDLGRTRHEGRAYERGELVMKSGGTGELVRANDQETRSECMTRNNLQGIVVPGMSVG